MMDMTKTLSKGMHGLDILLWIVHRRTSNSLNKNPASLRLGSPIPNWEPNANSNFFYYQELIPSRSPTKIAPYPTGKELDSYWRSLGFNSHLPLIYSAIEAGVKKKKQESNGLRHKGDRLGPQLMLILQWNRC